MRYTLKSIINITIYHAYTIFYLIFDHVIYALLPARAFHLQM
jgi:hypothetical protein